MSDENELIVNEMSAEQAIALLDSKSSKYATPEAVGQVTSAGDYLPYIQLMGSSNALVKQGKFPVAHFAMFKDKKPVDLGEVFIAYLVAWRPKAVYWDPIKVYYNPNSASFKKIEDGAKAGGQNNKNACGAEFLIWIPDHLSLATYFMGNTSGRMESPNLIDLIDTKKRVCKLQSEFVSSKRTGNTWHAPRCLPHDLNVTMPDWGKIMPLVDKFNNPPEQEEVTPEAAGADRG